MRLEAVLDAAANQPATVGARPGPTRRAREVYDSVASHPTAAQLGEDKPAVIHEANPTAHCAYPVVAHRA